MKLSFNIARLLHKAYPFVVFAVVLMTWATSVQGGQTPPSNIKKIWSPHVCSLKSDPDIGKTRDSCRADDTNFLSAAIAVPIGYPFGLDLSGILKKI